MSQQVNRYSRYYRYIKPFIKIPIVRNYGSLIFSLLAMTIFIFFAIKPTIETIIVLRKKLADSEEVYKLISKKAENLATGQENYNRLSGEVKNKIEEAIPKSVSLKSLAQTLEQSALQNQASVSALQIQPLTLQVKKDESLGSVSEIDFVFNAEGNYQDLVSLLQQIQRGARLISIDNVVINNTGENGALIMSLTGKSFILLMNKKEWLVAVILTFITICAWVIFDIAHARSQVEIPTAWQEAIEPIDPEFDLKVLDTP